MSLKLDLSAAEAYRTGNVVISTSKTDDDQNVNFYTKLIINRYIHKFKLKFDSFQNNGISKF